MVRARSIRNRSISHMCQCVNCGLIAFAQILALAVLAAAPLLEAQAEPRMGIHGSNTVGEKLMPALLEGYAASLNLKTVRVPGANSEEETLYAVSPNGPEFTIDLRRYGSGTSAKGLLSGEASLGMSSRRIKDAEAEAISSALGVDMKTPASEHVVALDGIAAIVSPQNPLTKISLSQLARIFSGDITDWSQLGLAPGPISVHARDDLSGTFDTFKSLVLKPFDLDLIPTAARYASNDQLAQVVAEDPMAIGFTPLATAGLAKSLSIELECGMLIGPDKFSVKAEEYPLGRRLYVYSLGEVRDPLPRDLLNYMLSDGAQQAVAGVGFVDQSIQVQTGEQAFERIISALESSDRAAEAVALQRLAILIREAERLSVTARFQTAVDQLDGKAILDIGRLARWMQRPENQSRYVRLLGFADSVGGFDANISLARRRAEAAQRALLAQLPQEIDHRRVSVDSFSTLAPVACNETEAGRSANRRVEVWVSSQ